MTSKINKFSLSGKNHCSTFQIEKKTFKFFISILLGKDKWRHIVKYETILYLK